MSVIIDLLSHLNVLNQPKDVKNKVKQCEQTIVAFLLQLCSFSAWKSFSESPSFTISWLAQRGIDTAATAGQVEKNKVQFGHALESCLPEVSSQWIVNKGDFDTGRKLQLNWEKRDFTSNLSSFTANFAICSDISFCFLTATFQHV